MRWFLFRVLGKRVLLGYGIVSLLSVAVLASLYLTSQYAIHGYVADQLGRIPWDVTAVQKGEVNRAPELARQFGQLTGVQRLERVGVLRVRNVSPVRVEVNGHALPVRWIGFVSASTVNLMPPQFRQGFRAAGAGETIQTQLALVGTETMAPPTGSANGAGAAVASSNVVRFGVVGPPETAAEHEDEDEGAEPAFDRPIRNVLFEAAVSAPPVQVERQEFNKWILRDLGSLSYLPEEALLISVPLDTFERLSATFHRLFLTSEGIRGVEDAPPYLPEATHVMRVDRSAWVSAWDLPVSIDRIAPIVRNVFTSAQWLTPFSYVNSDLHLMLVRMNTISRLVGLVSLLLAIPLLWLGWVLGQTLSGLLVLNERRLIGLTIIRGIPLKEIQQTLLLSLVGGGLLGGLLGLLIGTFVPVLGYMAAGIEPPPPVVIVRGLAYFAVFLLTGVVMALVSGRAILQYVRTLTPREAVARVEISEADIPTARVRGYSVAVSLAALALGTYKLVVWLRGESPVLSALSQGAADGLSNAASLAETLLNFLAVPLLLFGLAGLLMWRATWVQRLLSAATTPIVGSLHWFVGQQMALARHRIVKVLFVAALAMALSLLPQVSADTFYGRVLRGIRTSVGGSVLFDFNMVELAGGSSGPAPLAKYPEKINGSLQAIRRVLEGSPQVASVSLIEQYIVLEVYVPGQSGLLLNLVEDPEKYVNTVYYEDTLGKTKPFAEVVRALDRQLSVSEGLLRVRQIPIGRDVTLGYSKSGTPLRAQFENILSFLPGQPSTGIAQREGYVAAEIDYLNYMLGSDARMIAGADFVRGSPLGELEVLPSRAVFIVRTREGVSEEAVVRDLSASLPVRPEDVRWEGVEQQRVSKDMFISLALENMKVYMGGGLILALAAVAAIGTVNFIADRRLYALLRLRGLSPGTLLRISVSTFLTPVLLGVMVGAAVGVIAGYGVSQTIWELPRVYGVAGLLGNRLAFSGTAWLIVVAFSSALALLAIGFGVWPFRRSAREGMRER